MNTRNFRLLIASGPILVLLAGTAEAGRRGPPVWGPPGQHHEYRSVEYARVTGVRPLFESVATRVPVRECYEGTAYGPAPRGALHRPGVVGSTVAGGVIGGVIGDRFGGGDGRDAMRLFGGLVGAAIGHDVGTRRHAAYYPGAAVQSYPVTECVTRYETQVENIARGYEVSYRYQGRDYVTRTATPPGKRIPIEVSMRPY